MTVAGARAAVLDGLRRDGEDLEIDAAGATLLPGLHDHHLHLLAMAAASIDCRRAATGDELGLLLRAGRSPDPTAWIRATGYHESIAGDLDRHLLDRLVPDRPVRVQHRSGALWMLNSLALTQVAAALDDSADVERDATGTPTGRLWRYDARLRPALPSVTPDLSAVGDRLLRLGITSVTDATPDLEPGAISLLSQAQASGALPHDVVLLGAPDDFASTERLHQGPAKLLLRDHDPPDVDEIAAWIEQRRRTDRAVAVHCVSAESLILTLAALEAVGTHPADRIEHAGVVPPSLRADLTRLGVRVVTNPGFVAERGESYLADMHPDEVPFLYPYRSLRDAGIAVAAASDAPYGDADPFRVISAALTRMTPTGTCLGASETVSAQTALDGYLSAAMTPGGEPEQVQVGSRRGLCLLDRSWPSAPPSLSGSGGHKRAPDDLPSVRAAVAGGRVVEVRSSGSRT